MKYKTQNKQVPERDTNRTNWILRQSDKISVYAIFYASKQSCSFPEPATGCRWWWDEIFVWCMKINEMCIFYVSCYILSNSKNVASRCCYFPFRKGSIVLYYCFVNNLISLCLVHLGRLFAKVRLLFIYGLFYAHTCACCECE